MTNTRFPSNSTRCMHAFIHSHFFLLSHTNLCLPYAHTTTGYQPLPKYIPQEPFDKKIQKCGNKEVRQLATEWYLLDENQLPPRYSLKNLTREQNDWSLGAAYDGIYWDTVLPKLREVLDGIAFDPDVSDKLKIGQAVTDWEFISGTLSEDDVNRSWWLYRPFTEGVWPKDKDRVEGDKFPYHFYNDTDPVRNNMKKRGNPRDPHSQLSAEWDRERKFIERKKERLTALQNDMRQVLGDANKIHYFRSLSMESIKSQDNAFSNYISRFGEKNEQILKADIYGAAESLKHWAFDGCGLGIPGKLMSEFCHHIAWAKAKISSFKGRDDLVGKCLEAIKANNAIGPLPFTNNRGNSSKKHAPITAETAFKGLALAIVGKSGSGKTALVSRVTQAVREDDEKYETKRIFVVRFCGTSTASSDGLSLVQGICQQILVSTLSPVEPLLVGSKVEHDQQGYGTWFQATITKCHKDGTFDLSYDDQEPTDDEIEKDVNNPTGQTRERLRLRKNSEEQNLSLHSEVEVESGEKGVWSDAKIIKVHADDTFDVRMERSNIPGSPKSPGKSESQKSSKGGVGAAMLNLPRAVVRLRNTNKFTDRKIWDFSRIPTTYDRAVQYMHRLLGRYPVLLVIDSLDQLSNNYKERSELSFLRGLRPHPQTRVIVTTLPDDEQYFYLCDNRLALSNVPRVIVEPLAKDGDLHQVSEMAQAMLEQRNRKLTEQQLCILEKAIEVEPTALYVNLAVNSIVCHWDSYTTDPNSLTLVPTVKGIIGQIFDNLERDFGKTLVDATLIILTLSVDGVSDVEMQDLLSIDDKVLNFVFQYSRPDIERLPYHVWLRIRASLGSLLVEKEGGCLAWYHRQLKEVGRARFPDQLKRYYSSLMGQYFGNKVPHHTRENRLIKAQPFILNNIEVFLPEAHINRRRCIEASHHMIEAGDYDAAIDEMCCMDALYANTRVSRTHCFDYLSRVLRLQSIFQKMRATGTRRLDRLNSEIKQLKLYFRTRTEAIQSLVAARISSIREENPKLAAHSLEIINLLFQDDFKDLRSTLSFRDMLDEHPDCHTLHADAHGHGLHPKEVKAQLLDKFPLTSKKRNIVQHCTELVQDIIKEIIVDKTGDGQVLSLSDIDIDLKMNLEVNKEEESVRRLHVLEQELEEERMDYGEYASSRISILRSDFDSLSSVRKERHEINEQCRKEVLEKIAEENPRLETSSDNKAYKNSMRFYMKEHCFDSKHARSIIKKLKVFGWDDLDRTAARENLENSYPLKGKTKFSDHLVSLAESMIDALGKHWVRREHGLRYILDGSGETIFRDRDRAIKTYLSEYSSVIRLENLGVPMSELARVDEFLNHAFTPVNVQKTVDDMQLKESRDSLQVNLV